MRRSSCSARALRAAVAIPWLTLLVAAEARGETDARSRTLAESLFREGKALMDEGNAAAACPKLEESQRLDPGGGTLLNLAVCHEQVGRLATAWAEYSDALAIARRDGRADRAKLAAERVKALAPRLTRLTIEVGEDRPADFAITLDGSDVPLAAWGSALPVDPGDHDVVARAAGRRSFTARVAVAPDGAPSTVTVPPLEPEAAAAPTVVSAPAPARPAPPATPKPAPPEHGEAGDGYFVPQRIAGVSLTVIGAIGCLVGTGAGIAAIVKKGVSDDECEGDFCTHEGLALSDEALAPAHVSTASFVIGGAALATGIIVWATATSEEPAPTVVFIPAFGPGGGGASIAGRF